MQHLLGTCCSNVQDHAAKQIDWFLYFQFFTSSTPSETMRSSGSKAGCGKSNLGSRLRWKRPATFSPLRLQHFLWRPLPGRQSFGGGDLMACPRGPPGCGPLAENRESETTRRDIAPPLQSTILHMSSIRTKLLNYIQLFQLGTFPE